MKNSMHGNPATIYTTSADKPLKRQLLQLLIHQIEIHREEIRIVYKVLPPLL